MKLRFSGSRALLLGGSSDLGLELADLLIQENIFPFLTCRSSIGEEKINDRLKQHVGNYKVLYLDFCKMETIESVFDKVNHDLDFMIDFAHGDFEGLVGSVDSSDVYAYFAENISARAEVIKRTGRAMLRKKKGRLIFISSSATGNPNPGQGFYAASKLASEALYRNLGLELKDRGVTAISLRPGYINAGRGKRYLQSKQPMSFGSVVKQDVLTTKEMVETILFFLSDSAAGFTASTITVGEQFKKKE
jgi:3-oxoacyl-[acyl-carrier protein] reductase